MKRYLRDYVNKLMINSKNLKNLSYKDNTSFRKALELRNKHYEIEEKIKFIINITDKIRSKK